MSVVIETTLGDITVDLFVKERPKACLNFLKLCKLKYYNYNLFHTIEPGFIAQTGHQSGDQGSDKGESVWGVLEGPNKKYFEAEMMPKILHSVPGLLRFVYFSTHHIRGFWVMCLLGLFQYGFDRWKFHRISIFLHFGRWSCLTRRNSLCHRRSRGRAWGFAPDEWSYHRWQTSAVQRHSHHAHGYYWRPICRPKRVQAA